MRVLRFSFGTGTDWNGEPASLSEPLWQRG